MEAPSPERPSLHPPTATTLFSAKPSRHKARTRLPFAARLFGYDIFLSFALGPPPRGTLGYASDLARRLRERDFTVFFSEVEAPLGEELDRTLRAALLKSKILVVVANRGTLEEPRWVRQEVEEFRRARPGRPVIPISVDGALLDPRLASDTQAWLGHEGRIWLDESAEAVSIGVASEAVAARLATAPTRVRSNDLWRWLVRGTIIVLVILEAVAGRSAWIADRNAKEATRQQRLAEDESRRARGATLLTAARAETDPGQASLLLAEFDGTDMQVPAGALAWAIDLAQQAVPCAVLRHNGAVSNAAFSPDSDWVVTASGSVAHIWKRDGRGQARVLQGHQKAINAAVFDPLGERVLTVSDDTTARVWPPADGAPPLVLRGHSQPVVRGRFSPDGRLVVTASADGTARVWDSTREGVPITLSGHHGSVVSAVFSPDGRRVLTASEDGTARMWNVDGTGEPLVLRSGQAALVSAVFDPSGQRVLTASRDGKARIHGPNWQAAPLVLEGHVEALWGAEFSDDGGQVLTASWDKTARLWNAKGGGAPIVLGGHQAAVRGVGFDPSGTHVITASADGTARVWRRDGTGEAVVLRGHAGPLWFAAFSADGRWALTGSDDGSVRIWPAGGASQPVVLRGHGSRIRQADFSLDGTRVLTASDDATARLWMADGSGTAVVLGGHGQPVVSARFSRDGTRMVTSSEGGLARVWKADGMLLFEWPGDGSAGAGADFMPDGRHILLGTLGGPVVIWDTGTPMASTAFDGDNASGASFSADGRRVAFGSTSGRAYVWAATAGGSPVELPGPSGSLDRTALSPGGDRLAGAYRDGGVLAWHIDEPGKLPLELTGHQDQVTDLSYAPGGDQLLSASMDGTARVWRIDRPEVPRVLEGGGSVVVSARFDREGRQVVTASGDGAARLWRLAIDNRPIVIPGNGSRLTGATFSPDGSKVLTSAEDGSARILLVEWNGLLKDLRTRTTDCLPLAVRVDRLGEDDALARSRRLSCERRFGRAPAGS